MNAQERLFLAIGEADPELIARSEKTRRTHWLRYGLAMAACLALILTLGRAFVLRPEPPVLSGDPPPAAEQDPPGDDRTDKGQLSLPEQGSEIGTLRLLRYAPESQSEAVDFLIYVNEEQFVIREEDGLYQIRSIDPLPDTFPECGMDITHLSGTTPSQAQQAAEAALRERGMEISAEELSAALPGSLYLRASAGLEWDAEEAELWFADDGQGGTFVLIARYFLEAEEGLGARFRDMVSSFRAVDLNETVPDWMRELHTAADQFSQALFANDLSGISGLLTEDAITDAYGEDVWSDISIISVDCTLDDDKDPSQAVVSVKHRLNRVEGDSFSYLTMNLVRRDGTWYLDWSGLEK